MISNARKEEIQKRVNHIVATILLGNLKEDAMNEILAVAGYESVVTPKGQKLIVSIRKKSRRGKAERRPQRKGACWWRPKTRRKS